MPAFYASPDGTGDGLTPGTPGSLATVKALAAAATGNVIVDLRGGLYQFTAPLLFTAADSGNGGTISWQARANELPRFSGGLKVEGWTLHDAAKNIWRANVPPGTASRQLWVNGVRGRRARPSVDPVITKQFGVYTCTDAALPVFSRPQDIEFVFVAAPYLWTHTRCMITGASRNGNTTTFAMDPTIEAEGASYGLAWPSSPTYIENAYEFLAADTPGNWYLNPDTAVLYYVPRANEDMATADVRLGLLETLIDTDPASPLTDVEFKGISFEHTTWMEPTTLRVYRDPGGGRYATPAVRLKGSQRVTVRRCAFKRLGGSGVVLELSTQSCKVLSCVFRDIALMALRDGEGTGSYPQYDTLVRSCYAYDVPNEYHGTCFLTTYSIRAKFLHNHVERAPSTAIGGSTGNGLPCGEAEWAYNRIVEPMMVHADGSGLNKFGPSDSGGRSSIHDNYVVSTVRTSSVKVHCVYLDNWTSHWDVHDNVCIQRVAGAPYPWGFNNSESRDIHVYDNFANTGSYWSLTNYEEGAEPPGFTEWNTATGQINLTGDDPAGWPAAAQEIVNASGLDPADADLLTWDGVAALLGWDLLEVEPTPAVLALTALVAAVSLINSITDRFKFPGPLKIWNGSSFTDAPFKSFDGSTIN